MTKGLFAGFALNLASTNPLIAQENLISWSGDLEIGFDGTISSGDPASEFTDNYASLETSFEAGLAQGVALFGTLTLESVIDPTDTRHFEDIGLYVSALGLEFEFAHSHLKLGKINPTFAIAWDAAPGFYGTSLAEDYELNEAIGVTLDTPLQGTDGTLSMAVFYADDTGLSDSFGVRRGRNITAHGGAGNTGKLNNVALQYLHIHEDSTYWIGGRFLTASKVDVSDELGAVVGMAHSFDNGFDIIFEIAHFDGFAGGATNATYTTVGSSYAHGPWEYSASFTGMRDSAAGHDHVVSIGLDYLHENDIAIGGGVALYNVAGVKSTAIGASVMVPF